MEIFRTVFVQDSARKFPGQAPPFPAESRGLAGAGSGTPFGWIRRGTRETGAICIGRTIQKIEHLPRPLGPHDELGDAGRGHVPLP